MSHRAKLGEKKVNAMREAVETKRRQKAALEEELLAAEADLDTQEKEVAALSAQLPEITTKVGGAPGKAELWAPTAGVEVNAEALGELLASNGVGEEQSGTLA
ncbi:unnamed protein product [Prorocentrum cordatum]|uniref:Uncharacterized protein n=1 Tax=Prorocentrum cordatum TaxID=2364126 RepID=A0ABN9QJI7_9DINO|nr:unnamed protein product [Polarella glacialis]